MKLACSSGVASRFFESGELTQLEFLDLCAREFGCENVVLDVRHFPRTDGDYLAQIKKMAVDLGLGIAAVEDESFLVRDEGAMHASAALALTVGAPILITHVAAETAMSWSEQLERLNAATGIAKASNVTLGVRNSAGTFAATALDFKRVSKEADSAWLRYALAPDELDAASDAGPLVEKAVVLCATLRASGDAIDAFVARFSDFRGPLVLGGGALARPEIANATAVWRVALAKHSLNRT